MSLETDLVMAGDRVYAALRMVRALGVEPDAVTYGMGQAMVVKFTWHGYPYELHLTGGTTAGPIIGAVLDLPPMGAEPEPRAPARQDEVHAAMVMALVAFHRASAPQVGTLEQLVHRAYQVVGSGHVREPWVEDDVVEAIRQVLGR